MHTVELTVQGMTCGHCVQAVTRAIQALDAAARVSVELEKGRLHAETALDRAEVVRAVEGEGYRVAA